MSRSIAFLRAINVGGRVVKMDVLRQHFVTLNLANVETFIASGNVIFESAHEASALEKLIETQLRQSLGYEVKTFVRSAGQVKAIADYQPFGASALEEPGSSLYIAFLPSQPELGATEKLMTYRNEVDDFHIHDSQCYWLCRRKFSESTFSGALLEKTLGLPATVRNSTTVKKLAAKYATP
jgi:uncharacterized protein (DUF1697 family)